MPELAFYLAAALLVGMPCAMIFGRRAALRIDKGSDEGADAGVGALDAAIYGLFGLLLAFIFSGAASRFDHRREMIVSETNAIGTAYLRVDLLPAETQASLRPLFRSYVESRLATYRKIDEGLDAAMREYRHSLELQTQIWRQALAGAQRTANPAVYTLVLSALNEMIDITTTRLAASRFHPPTIIYAMIFVLGLATAFLAGTSMAKSRRRHWPHVVAFSLVISATVFVIIDIEFPRLGFIRVDSADLLLVELLESMQ